MDPYAGSLFLAGAGDIQRDEMVFRSVISVASLFKSVFYNFFFTQSIHSAIIKNCFCKTVRIA